MTTRGKVLVGVGVVLLGAAVVAANLYYKKADGKIVAVEAIKKRDLESMVSASGKIQAKTQVNVSADTMAASPSSRSWRATSSSAASS